jgi:membrane-bound metal-dependent hydrolase YbcI (DUF457 family)
MPLTNLHAVVGGLAGASFYAVERTFSDKEIVRDDAIAHFMFGALAGSLPDILEPPLHRRHRRFFHSYFTLGATALALASIDDLKDASRENKLMLKAMLSAYMTHLLLDSTTPKGLPAII